MLKSLKTKLRDDISFLCGLTVRSERIFKGNCI